MNSFALVAFFAAIAAASASVFAPAIGVLEGPSTRTTIVGPEGSVISSVAPGGKVITEGLPAGVAYNAPALITPYAAPGLIHASYVAARAEPWVAPYPAPVVSAYAAPVVPATGSVNTVVAGPSGTVAASRSLTAADLVAPLW